MIIEEVVKGVLHLPILYVGIGATTLSSALSYLLGAPRIISAIARDDSSAHPLLRWFSVRSNVFAYMFTNNVNDDRDNEEDIEDEKRGDESAQSGPRKEPQRALLLTWIISQSLLLTGALDKLSKLMTCT